MRTILSLALASFFTMMPAIAQTPLNFEITPMVGYRFGGSFEAAGGETNTRIELKEGTSYGLITAWSVDRKHQGEFLISHYDTSFSESNDFSASNTGLSITYAHIGGNVPISEGFMPTYVTGGLGLTHFSPEDADLGNETRFSLNVGLASKIPFTEHISFRLDSRLYGTFFNTEGAVFCGPNSCAAHVSSSIWIQGEVNAGVTVSF